MEDNKLQCFIKEASTAIGAGLIAGFAGTVAITACQLIEMRITKRKAGVGPAVAVEKTLDIHVDGEKKKEFSWKVHWVYGSLWGIVRGILGVSRINRWVADTAHFAAITGTAMALAPLEGAKPVDEWDAGEIGKEILHHAVYAAVTGLVFEAIYQRD